MLGSIKKRIFVGAAVTVAILALLTGCKTKEKELTKEEIQAIYTKKAIYTDELTPISVPEDTHFTFTPNGDGFNVYQTPKGSAGYRYAPSILFYNDGTWDSWFATNGTKYEWDWISYKTSSDGVNFGGEQIVLQPTPDSMDHYSVCDPGIIYFNGYFYLGYTSTIVATSGGINNNIYVSRSVSPNGPFEKWNGSGWGGDPAPIIYYNEDDRKWGAGEPAFVVVDDTLYIYYTWACADGNYEMVATADATSENWPATMEFHGSVGTKTGDQCDAVYVEDVGMFLLFSTENRFSAQSGIRIMESFDGIHFTLGEFVSNGVAKYCHNMGVSKRPNGHIQLSDPVMLGYAYASDGDSWGQWGTYFQPINLSYYSGKLNKSDNGNLGSLKKDAVCERSEDDIHIIGISTGTREYKLSTDYTNCKIDLLWLDQYLGGHGFEDDDYKNLKLEYDKTSVLIEGDKIVPLKTGTTLVKAYYKEPGADTTYFCEFKIKVYEPGFHYDIATGVISSFTPVESEFTVSLSGKHSPQIRGLVKFANDTWGEAYNDSTKDHPDYPAMVNAVKFKMTYEPADTSIATVNSRGIIKAKKVGDTTVIVKMNDDLQFTVTIHVVE